MNEIAELEDLESQGVGTSDTHEELVDLHEFLGNLCKISLERTGRTIQ